MPFPAGFVWGAASAAYQIEGACDVDGKGPSVWDMFAHKEGAIWRGHAGDVACDHYHRYAEDVSLMRRIGLKAYRLSVSWPRVLPEGYGRVNEKGIAFYDRLVDALLEAGIAPWVTAFHWDLPLALYRQGGFLNRDSAEWFAEYVGVLAARLSDRVAHWITFNEPQCFVVLGLGKGIHAPGDKLGADQLHVAKHNVLRAHGKGVQALRAHARRPLKIGYAPVGVVSFPATESAADGAAAERRTFAISPALWDNVSWCDPVFLGRYPLAIDSEPSERLADDLVDIHQPLDFCGTNIYLGTRVRSGPGDEPEIVPEPPGMAATGLNWAVTPEAMFHGPRLLFARYGKPIVITENGLTSRDWVAVDGAVHDPARIDFMTRYLRELHRAIEQGVPVTGYFHWSVMDNFEWAEGYKERFGLIHVDYETQRRTLKDSALWYARLIGSNGELALKSQRRPVPMPRP